MYELELELIQPHMALKPVLRGEVGYSCVAREVSVERGVYAENKPLQVLGLPLVPRGVGFGPGSTTPRWCS